MHPRWDATGNIEQQITKLRFQFMQPGWDATIQAGAAAYLSAISIHAARVGCNCKI